MTNKIYIIDVTNRDGVQAPKLSLSKFERTLLNWYLDKLGIFQSEVGFPFSIQETNYIEQNLKLFKKRSTGNLKLGGWCRANGNDIKQTFKLTNIKHLNISVPTSEVMLKYKLRNTLNQNSLLRKIPELIKLAYDCGAESVTVNAEDASRTKLNFLIELGKVVKQSKAVRMRYCDTLGLETPLSIYKRLNFLAREIKLPLETHCHNDLGLAVACSVMGAKGIIEAGCDAYINTTVMGIGERAGNADLVSTLLALTYGKEFQNTNFLFSQINLKVIWPLTRYVLKCFGIEHPLVYPGIGRNAFSHESGIHVDGVLKNKKNYELYDFENLGREQTEEIITGREITLGEYSGMSGLKKVFMDLGLTIKNEKSARFFLNLVRHVAIHTQKPLTIEEIKFIYSYPQLIKSLVVN